MQVADIVDDEENAPLALLDVVKVNRAAEVRRAVPADDIRKLGDRLSTRLALISKLKDRWIL
ncbi:hypothetical protein BDW75DRAFT_89823 [Aspergillus navahoensis]